jgi:hypothetical protein
VTDGTTLFVGVNDISNMATDLLKDPQQVRWPGGYAVCCPLRSHAQPRGHMMQMDVPIRGPKDEKHKMSATVWYGKKDMRVIQSGRPLIADPVSFSEGSGWHLPRC